MRHVNLTYVPGIICVCMQEVFNLELSSYMQRNMHAYDHCRVSKRRIRIMQFSHHDDYGEAVTFSFDFGEAIPIWLCLCRPCLITNALMDHRGGGYCSDIHRAGFSFFNGWVQCDGALHYNAV